MRMMVRSWAMKPPIIARICCLMSRGCPWSVSAVIVIPGRSTSDRLGTCGEWMRRKIGSADTPFCLPARASVASSMAVRICPSCAAVGSGHVSPIVVSATHAPSAYRPNSARISAASGWCVSWSESGARVTICSPSGRISAPMMPLSSDDLPLDCVPTTTSRGTSGCLSEPAAPASSAPAKMPSRVLATRSISELPSPRSVPSSGTAASATVAVGLIVSAGAPSPSSRFTYAESDDAAE
mmetsp:Transcript_45785/g.127132  ORF Transcript_45785/g.127132 Transcript_45785/m.127132 type:complete len:239 (-) Transcript_45785:144-860(-)